MCQHYFEHVAVSMCRKKAAQLFKLKFGQIKNVYYSFDRAAFKKGYLGHIYDIRIHITLRVGQHFYLGDIISECQLI